MSFKKKSLELQQSSIENDELEREDHFGSLSDVTATEIDWLWFPFILFSALTLMEGDPGIGKSFFAMYLAALVSSGGNFPNGDRVRRGRVLYLSSEDDPSFTMKPRIEKMGGDPSRVRYLKKYLVFDDPGLIVLQSEISRFKPDLIIVDPLYGFIDAGVNIHSANQIREILSALNEIAQACGAAVVIVRHLRKGVGKALYQGAGVIDVIGAARSALLVAIDPQNDDLRVVAHLKHNLSARGESYLFELVAKAKNEIPDLVWVGMTELTADDITGVERDGSAREDAIEFLRDNLSNGPVAQKEMMERGEKDGHAKRTLDRAKKDLGVFSKKHGSVWFWCLPAS